MNTKIREIKVSVLVKVKAGFLSGGWGQFKSISGKSLQRYTYEDKELLVFTAVGKHILYTRYRMVQYNAVMAYAVMTCLRRF